MDLWVEKYGHKTGFIFVWVRDSGANVSSKNRQDRAGVMAVIQKKKALKLLQRLLYSRLSTQTVCRFYRTKPSMVNGIYSTRLYLITPCFHSVCIFWKALTTNISPFYHLSNLFLKLDRHIAIKPLPSANICKPICGANLVNSITFSDIRFI